MVDIGLMHRLSICIISGWEYLLDLGKDGIEARKALFCCLWPEGGRKEREQWNPACYLVFQGYRVFLAWDKFPCTSAVPSVQPFIPAFLCYGAGAGRWKSGC